MSCSRRERGEALPAGYDTLAVAQQVKETHCYVCAEVRAEEVGWRRVKVPCPPSFHPPAFAHVSLQVEAEVAKYDSQEGSKRFKQHTLLWPAPLASSSVAARGGGGAAGDGAGEGAGGDAGGAQADVAGGGRGGEVITIKHERFLGPELYFTPSILEETALSPALPKVSEAEEEGGGASKLESSRSGTQVGRGGRGKEEWYLDPPGIQSTPFHSHAIPGPRSSVISSAPRSHRAHTPPCMPFPPGASDGGRGGAGLPNRPPKGPVRQHRAVRRLNAVPEPEDVSDCHCYHGCRDGRVKIVLSTRIRRSIWPL
jgi:hypothetical protein